jgi:hypothetical protein
MGIIIKEENNEYWLYDITHTPVNFTPFTNPDAIQDFSYSFKKGRIKDLCGMELEKEYDLNIHEDFEIVDRIKQVKHDNGLVHDDLFYQLKK